MKRVIAVSDSHGDKVALQDALLQAMRGGKIDAAVFLGDGIHDFEAVRPMLTAQGILCYCVRGNNDWSSSEPNDQLFTLGGVRFYICHGHGWHVKYGLERLWFAAREREADIALYGHTHIANIHTERGMHLVNPGSVGAKNHNAIAYAEILVYDNRALQPRLVKWE